MLHQTGNGHLRWQNDFLDGTERVGDSRPEFDVELDNQEEDRENLAAYSLNGAYGKEAFEALKKRFILEQLRESIVGTTTTTTTATAKLPAISRSTGRAKSSRHQAKFGQSKRNHRVNARSVNGQQQRGGQEQHKPDPGSVYRDQIYWFDGHSNSVILPKAIYATNQSRPFVFGRRHTFSFWMRHSPFKFTNQRVEKNVDKSGSSARAKDDLDELSRHVKEHLLCAVTNGDHISQTTEQRRTQRQSMHHRHHYYSLFLRNCKLILLMRRLVDDSNTINEANQSSSNNQQSKTYMPAEWRWTLSANETCDNKWHFYAINIDYPSVELYVDGQQFEESYDNLVIVDDLPLHYSTSSLGSSIAHSEQDDKLTNNGTSEESSQHDAASQLSLALSVGACWDSRQQSMDGHFRGSLAGINVLLDDTDDSRTLECLGQCSEALVSTATSANQMHSDQQDNELANGDRPAAPTGGKLDNSLVAYQESQSMIQLQGHDFLDVEDALTQIAYTHRGLLPSVGERSILLSTSIVCSTQVAKQDESSATFSVPIEPVKVEVNVLPSKSLPVIMISGQPNLARDYQHLIQGIHLFSSTRLHVKHLNIYHLHHQHGASTVATSKASSSISSSSISDSVLDYIDDSVKAREFDSQSTINQHPMTIGDQSKLNDSNSGRTIESCSVKIHPPLNGLHEQLHLPYDELNRLQLYWRQSHEGLVIYGVDSLENYQNLLHSMIYSNQKPAYYIERVFKLLCSDMNGRLVSNEYSQTVTIIHLESDDLQQASKIDSSSQHKLSPEDPSSPLTSGHRAIIMDKADSKPSMLRRSPELEVSFVDSIEPTIERGPTLGVNQKLTRHQPLTMLDMEQSTSVDRIAMAFLVFVISLIVIMVVIALTNLKEPGIKDSTYSHVDRTLSSGRSRMHPHALSYDIDSSLDDKIPNFEEEDEDDDDDEEEDEDEYERIQVPHRRVVDCDHEQLLHNHPTPNSICHKAQRQLAKNYSISSQTTDMESLAWDDEHFDDNTVTIVMNPIVHGNNHAQLEEEEEGEEAVDDIYRTFITEQRPDRCGSMTQRPKSHLTYHSSLLTASRRQSLHHQSGINLSDVDIEPGNQPETVSSSCSSSSSTVSESSSPSSSDSEGGEEIAPSLCERHTRERPTLVMDEDGFSSSSSDHYELYHSHHHQHHFHHDCLKQTQQHRKKNTPSHYHNRSIPAERYHVASEDDDDDEENIYTWATEPCEDYNIVLSEPSSK